MIDCADLFPDQPAPLRSLDEANDRVVALLQKFRKLGNRSPAAASVTGNAQDKLVLLRRHAGGSYRFLTEAEKPSQLVPEKR